VSAAAPANPCAAPLTAWLAAEPAFLSLKRWAVAFSGGADSTALLLAAHALCPGQVVALHVHHGLQAAADHFESHARAFCEARAIPFASQRVAAGHAPGESPEDAARRARYRCLAALATEQACHQVWLAQHADDQVETLLLALSRGAGLPGLASMPERFERHGMAFGRPILSVDGLALRAWLHAIGQPFIDDPTNADTRFTRNRIRQHLLPVWRAPFPSSCRPPARPMCCATGWPRATGCAPAPCNLTNCSARSPPAAPAATASSCAWPGARSSARAARWPTCRAPDEPVFIIEGFAACVPADAQALRKPL